MTKERSEMEKLAVQAIRAIDSADLMDLLALCDHSYARAAADRDRWLVSHFWERPTIQGFKARSYLEERHKWKERYRALTGQAKEEGS